MFNSNSHTVRNISLAVAVIILMITVVCSVALWVKVKTIDKQIINIQDQLVENHSANEKIFRMLNDIKEKQEVIDQKLDEQKRIQQEHATNVAYLKETGFGVESDLSSNNVKLNSDDMNKIINYWIVHMGVSASFQNKGQAFIDASKETGLNPVYILAHAAVESAWGNSYIAKTKHNYFGINAVDHDPGQSYTMGDCTESGIMEGARWIKRNYYDQGYTTLGAMKRGGYASDPNWSYNISSIMNQSLRAL